MSIDESIVKIIDALQSLGNEGKAAFVQRYFKTGKGHYAQGDVFWGISVPHVRVVAHAYRHISVNQIENLLANEVHEVRLCALLIMVVKSKDQPEAMYNLYLKKMSCINNWDLVDLSAPMIIGNFLRNKDCSILYALAQSETLWARRIAIISTFAFIKNGEHDHTLKIASILMQDRQDLIHKAVGWMLREVGKRCSVNSLEVFLEQHAATMPRTALRYAVEHLPSEKKKYFMQQKNNPFRAK